MEISGTMAAADLLQFLATTVKSELLSRVLASSRDVEGMAMPVFRLVGPPTAVTFAGGEIKAQHVNLTNAFLPERLTALQGRFVLAEGETQFDQVTAHLGDLTVQVQGGITGGSGSVFPRPGGSRQRRRRAHDAAPADQSSAPGRDRRIGQRHRRGHRRHGQAAFARRSRIDGVQGHHSQCP